MAANRGFTALAVVTLALGIGANTAIYSFVESILLRSLPVPDPDSLVVVKWHAREFPSIARSFSLASGGRHDVPGGGRDGSVFPYRALELFRGNDRIFSAVFGYAAVERLQVSASGSAESALGHYVSGDYVRGLGAPPFSGRLILPEHDSADAAPAVVLSHRLAVRYFGEAAQPVGQTVRINTATFTGGRSLDSRILRRHTRCHS
jgi:hypothetical protein